jgi:hypothetical protein
MAEHPTDTEQQGPPAPRAEGELDLLLSTGVQVLTCLVPGWEPPLLAHPHAVAYESAVDLMGDIVPGDQVMVLAPSGYYHHGIFVGKQHVAGINRPAVVDFWGESKERAAIGVRSLSDFVRGAGAFAKADYPQGAALPQELSARLALAWADADKLKTTSYNLVLQNCEVFATMCRCMRCAVACHNALTQQLAHMPAVTKKLFRSGFK